MESLLKVVQIVLLNGKDFEIQDFQVDKLFNLNCTEVFKNNR